MVEGIGLENRCMVHTVGSNPASSELYEKQKHYIREKLLFNTLARVLLQNAVFVYLC